MTTSETVPKTVTDESFSAGPDFVGLVEQAQTGSVDERAVALSGLFPHVHQVAYWTAVGTGTTEPEDIAAHTVLKLVEQTHAGNLRPENNASITSFARQTAKNKVISNFRYSSKRRIETDEELAQIPSADSTEDEVLGRYKDWDLNALYEAINLPDRQGTMLTMRFGDEADIGEAADKLGIDRHAASALQHRGIKKLREAITATMAEHDISNPEQAIIQLIANQNDETARAS
ncbi:sigma-70 family RNA polymerase sigma factor [Candidatus Saccharibacteria bacterium]|nr:MAG: sigma-70 family RNA polymerase sigma factor [Candidatus Saccharibacteria bacterium]